MIRLLRLGAKDDELLSFIFIFFGEVFTLVIRGLSL